jgi:hypothetical protein
MSRCNRGDAGGGSSVGDFTDLTDTPANYSGAGGKVVAVNSGATGLEYVARTLFYPVVSTAVLGSSTTISQVFSDVAGGGMAQIGAWEVSIVAPFDCALLVMCHFSCRRSTAGELVAGVQLGAATPVPKLYYVPNDNVSMIPCSFTHVFPNNPAGTYVVKAMASRSAADLTIYGANANVASPTLTVMAIPSILVD